MGRIAEWVRIDVQHLPVSISLRSSEFDMLSKQARLQQYLQLSHLHVRVSLRLLSSFSILKERAPSETKAGGGDRVFTESLSGVDTDYLAKRG